MTAHGRPSPAEFQVLLALLDGAKHGIAIQDDVSHRTAGSVHMGPGTLYGAIKRLLRNGWIEEVAGDEGGDGRHRYYSVTATGVSAARAEAHRMTALLGIAVDKSLIDG